MPTELQQRLLNHVCPGSEEAISSLTGAGSAAVTATVEAEQSTATVAVVAAEPAFAKTTIQRAVLSDAIVRADDRPEVITALELRALAARHAFTTQRDVSVCVRLGTDQPVM